MSDRIRFGISGLGGRAAYWIGDLMKHQAVEVVAGTDISPAAIERTREQLPSLTYCDSLQDMLKQDIDAVFVATPSFQHARDSIAALNAGKHVMSEVTACWTMAEAVELYEAAKESSRVYMLSENYCYFLANQEMRRLYEAGAIGELLYSDIHYAATYTEMWAPFCKNPDEWRSWMPQSYYSSHALGPLLWITGLRPIDVTGFAVANCEPSASIGKRSDEVASFMLTLSNGAVAGVTTNFIATRANHLWYHFSGTRGEMENDRLYDYDNPVALATVNLYNDAGQKRYMAEPPHSKTECAGHGHAGGDYFVLHDFVEAVLGRAPVSIDVRTGLEMSMPGILAHRSALMGNVELEVPDLDDPAARDRYRNDTASPFPLQGNDCPVPPSVLGHRMC
jgi:predicted dehydrogenase